MRIRVKHFLALNTHLLRLALCYFFSYYCFFSFFLFFFCMACWLALCPSSIYWMSQLFNILRQLLSQPGIWNGVCDGNPKSISLSVLKSYIDTHEIRVIAFGYPVRVFWTIKLLTKNIPLLWPLYSFI